MKTLSRFILNRNDKAYIYVKKNADRRNNIHYTVFYDKGTKENHKQDVFHNIHGSDTQISVLDFAHTARNEFMHFMGDNKEFSDCYDLLNDILDKISSMDKKNPKLKASDEEALIRVIAAYNSVFPCYDDELIDYVKDYLFIDSLEKDGEVSNNVLSVGDKYIKPYDYDYSYSYERVGVSRARKYDM